jgi:membrane associated rhomboid family serine protease
MGIYDRDYYRDPPRRGGFGNFSALSVTTWLIVVNVLVFVIDAWLWNRAIREQLTGVPRQFVPYMRAQLAAMNPFGPIESWGFFSVDSAIGHAQVWRVLSYQFLHANLMHLLFNMLGLYFFGPIVEGYLGRGRYLGFSLLCGCSGAVVYTLLCYAGVLPDAAAALVGASAAIYGVLIAAAVLAPDVTVMLFFPPVPLQLKYMAMIMVGIAAYTAFTNGRNAGGEAAHLGGAVLGYVLMRYPFPLNPFAPRAGPARARRRRVKFTDWSKDMNR